jgi:hypothetical protein
VSRIGLPFVCHVPVFSHSFECGHSGHFFFFCSHYNVTEVDEVTKRKKRKAKTSTRDSYRYKENSESEEPKTKLRSTKKAAARHLNKDLFPEFSNSKCNETSMNSNGPRNMISSSRSNSLAKGISNCPAAQSNSFARDRSPAVLPYRVLLYLLVSVSCWQKLFKTR